ncbi:MAG: hypothetical protein H6819_04130 [Phycisphaerales bacterium]|nr:hypothetical protein [Phycisphaerales bacterium]MCB9856387.1 hypothetical protein [Phycisphaerales bacterium]
MKHKTKSQPILLIIAIITLITAPNIASAVDLFKKLDVKKAALNGQWERSPKNPDMIRCQTCDIAGLDLAGRPDGDFTFRVECMRFDSEGPFGVYFPYGDVMGMFLVGGSKEDGTEGFTLTKGGCTGQNAIKGDEKPVVVKNNETIKIVLSVKGGAIRAKVNGKLVAELREGQGEIATWDNVIDEYDKLGLVAINAGVAFRKARLVVSKSKSPRPIKKPDDKKAADKPTPNRKEPPPEISVGDKWKGEYSTSVPGGGPCTMEITSRNKDDFHAVVEFANSGTLEFDFHYFKDRFVVENIRDRWSKGTRLFTLLQLQIFSDGMASLVFHYTLNDERHKNEFVHGNSIFDTFESKNPKPKPPPKPEGPKTGPSFPKLAVGEVWKGAYSDDIRSPDTCTVKITGLTGGWYSVLLQIGDDQAYAFEFNPDGDSTLVRNIQDRSKSGKREFRNIQMLRMSYGTVMMLNYDLTPEGHQKRSVFGQADFLKQ